MKRDNSLRTEGNQDLKTLAPGKQLEQRLKKAFMSLQLSLQSPTNVPNIRIPTNKVALHGKKIKNTPQRKSAPPTKQVQHCPANPKTQFNQFHQTKYP